MPAIVHFDISADDPGRAKKFYEALFGWKFELLPGPINYYLIETTDLGGHTGIGGGMAQREGVQQSGIVNYIGVRSIDESAANVEKNGGRIVQPKQAVPGWGYLAVCNDTENNIFGLFEEDKNAYELQPT